MPILIGLALGGQRLWMNIRPDDPLPAGFVQYTPEVFAEALTSDSLIMVDVYASWCPTCMAQHKVLNTLLEEERYRGIRGFRVDFDRDRDFVRQHAVRVQSTILLFLGGREISRSSGLTASDPIHRQVDHAIGVLEGASF